ncbi:DUF2818 family protein [Neisseria sp. Ec49-e6-T10]|uniref:DUF2818 family protein n=1 Tax=Neisseria sp. Ec49-e6-T10 TaxID=3140744 RepID=UPI003EB6AC9A
MTVGMGIFLLLAFLAANLPFMSKKVFFVISTKKKYFLFELLEWICYYFLMGILGYVLEKQTNGTAHSQDIVFYVVTLSLFIVFAFPGFVLRYFWSSKQSVRKSSTDLSIEP